MRRNHLFLFILKPGLWHWGRMRKMMVLFCFVLFYSLKTHAQVTTFTIDLSSAKDTSITISTSRNGNVCSGNNCVKFDITLNSGSDLLSLDVKNPAPNGASAFYQVNCGPQTSLATPVCVSGLTTVSVTFCKPGNDKPDYTISTSSLVKGSADLNLRQNCSGLMSVTGLQSSSITWTSIFPGSTGQYNSYLTCTSNCTSTTVTPQAGSPSYIDYKVSGSTSCAGTRADTIRVYTTPSLSIAITPVTPAICSGSAVTLTANPSGGNPPYSYVWSPGGGTLATTSATVAGTYTVTVSDNTSGCAPVPQAITVAALPTPSAPTAAGTTICAGNTATITASAPGGTYHWYDAATGGNLLFTGASYTTPVLNTTANYYVETTVSGCTSPRTTVTVTVTPTPAAPSVTPATICAGNTAVLAATGTGTLDWFAAASGGSSLQTGGSYTTPVLNISSTYYVQNTVSGCASTRTLVTATVNPIPAAPTAASTAICTGSSVTLNATAPGGTYSWYDVASGGSPLQTGASYTTPVINSNTNYYVQTVVSGCTSARTTVNISVNAIPPIPVVNPAGICTGNTATVTLNSPLSGVTYEWYSNSSGGTLLATGTSLTTPVLTANATYYVQANLAGCSSSSRIAATVTVSSIPSPPAASPVTICSGNTASLNATGSGTLDWFAAASGGSSLQTGTSFTTPVLTTSTSYYAQNTISGCASTRTPVTVTVNAIPAAPIAADVAICMGSSAVLTATSPGGSYDWFTTAAGGISAFTGASFTTPVLNATTTYYVQTTVSACISSRTMVTATANPIPAAPGVSSPTVCAGNTATLSVSSPAGGTTYQWYDAVTAGNLLTTSTSYTTPSLNSSTNYYVQATVLGCSSTRKPVTVTVNAIPAAPTAASSSTCSGNAVVLTASSPGGVYQWYDAVSGGNLLQTGATYTTPVLSNTVTYYVQATVSGCTGNRTAVTVTVTPIPSAPVANNAFICSGTGTILHAVSPGGTYQWYDAVSGGNLLLTGADYTTPVLSSTTSYYVQATVSGCTSSRTTVTVTVNPIPTAPGVSSSTVCAGNPATLSINSPTGGVTYEWYDAATAGNLLTTSTSYTTSSLNSSTNYYVQTNLSGCNSSRTTATVTVTPAPAAPTASPAFTCYGNTAVLTATAPGGTYQWYDAASGGNLLVTGANYTTPALTATTQYYVQTTVSGCAGSRTAVTANVNLAPAAPTVLGNTICAGNSTSLTATAPGGTYQWYDAASGGNLLLTGPNYITPALSNTTTYYVQSTVAGCTGSRSSTTITVLQTPAAPTVAGASICAGSATNLIASAPGGTYQWYDAASGGNLLYSGAAYTTASLTNTTIFYVQATVGACTGQRAGVTVTVNPIPAAPTAPGGTICAGNSLTLNASGSGSTYEWYDSNVSGNLLVTGTSFTTPVLNATTVYYVQTKLSGCTSTRTAVTATVLAIQQPAFQYPSGTFCSSGSNPTPVITGANGGTFSATPAGLVFVSTTTGEINVAASALGNYTIQLITSGPCVYSSLVRITITNAPNAAFAYAGPYCPQQSRTLPDFPAGASAGIFTATSPGLVFASNSTGEIDLQKSTPGTYNLTNTIAASAGCIAATATNTVTILSLPVANAGTSQSICAGNNATLNGSISGTASSGTWSGGAGSFTNASQLITQYKPANGESIVKLYLTTDDPSGPCIAAVDSVTLFINPIPATPVVQNTSVCTGNSATLIATSPGGLYEWYDIPAGGTPVASGIIFTSAILSTGTTYYVQSTINNCTSTRSPVTIGVSAKPLITSPAAGEVCSANPFTYLIVSDLAGTSYTWVRSAVTGISSPPSSGQTDSLITEVLNNTTNTSVPVTYSIVPTSKGCQGDPFFYTATVKPTPVAPVINNSTPVCAGSPLQLSTTTIAGATYQWSGPNGFSSSQQNPVVTNVSTASAGIYQLIVTVNSCSSSPAAKNIAPVIAAPTAASNSPLCEQGTLKLTAGGLPGATYNWSGPSGFSSVIQNPSLPSVKATDAGVYYVTASIAGCTGLTDSVTVSINVAPTTPTVISNSPVCSSDSIALKASGVSANANFLWSGPGGFTSTLPSPLIRSAGKTNEGVYNLTVSIPGCAITSASSVSVLVNQKPQISSIGNNSPLCEGDTLHLNAASIAGAVFSWNTISGYTSALENPVLYNVTKANEETYMAVATLNGCKSDTAITKVLITKPSIANAGSNSTVCANNASVKLSGSIIGEDTQTGIWSTDGNGLFIPNANQLSAVYVPGQADTAKRKTVLTLKTSNNKVCPVSASNVVIDITPAPTVNAGSDMAVCSNDSLITLLGAIANAGGGVWSASGSGRFQSTGSSLSKIYTPSNQDLQKGSVSFYLVSTGNANCIAVADTVKYSIRPVPFVDAGNDQTILENETIRLTPQVKGNGLQFLWTPAVNLSSDTIQNPLLTGKSNQEYTLRVTGTGACSVSDKVFIRVLKPFIIPNIFSPNGDGIHDEWVIPELANYPGAIVEIFTRSGMKIFSSVGYERPWDGTYNGKPVPVATYYYIIKPNFRNLLFSGSVTVIR